MTYSRRALYAAGEAFGESCTRREGGRLICGGGGGSSKAVTQGYDNRLVTGEGSLGLTGNKNSTVTTGGYSASGKNSSITAIDNTRLTDDRDLFMTTNQTDSRSWSDSSSRTFTDSSSTNINVESMDADIARAAFDFAKAGDATNAEGFDSLLGVAARLFDAGERQIAQTQDRVADAYANAGALAIDQAGRFDNKTIVVLVGLGAAAVAALAWGAKK